ncbi:MAG: hypothetical protein ACOCQR_01285 [bacterium]
MAMELENMSKAIYDMIDFLDHIKTVYENNKADIKEYNLLRCDYDHILELASLNAVQKSQLSRERTDMLRIRRIKKDQNKYYKPIYEVFKKHSDLKKALSKALLEINETKEFLEKRQYKARTKKGQELINKYSKPNDDLVTSAKPQEIKNLKEEIENRFNTIKSVG